VSNASAAGGVPGATNQRASASGLTADFGGTSSSITTGTSGAAGFALAATTGCGASTKVAGAVVSAVAVGSVVSAVAVGPNESAVIERVAPIANNNANASHMTVCFIAASPKPIEQKIRRIPQVRDGVGSFKINLGRLEADRWRWRVDLGASALRLRPGVGWVEPTGPAFGRPDDKLRETDRGYHRICGTMMGFAALHLSCDHCPSFASLPCFAASTARSASSGNSSRSATCRAASRRTAAT
jgi:hypothetical protein